MFREGDIVAVDTELTGVVLDSVYDGEETVKVVYLSKKGMKFAEMPVNSLTLLRRSEAFFDLLRELRNEELEEKIPVSWMQWEIDQDKENDHLDEYGEWDDSTTLGESCEHVLANWYNSRKWSWSKSMEDEN